MNPGSINHVQPLLATSTLGWLIHGWGGWRGIQL